MKTVHIYLFFTLVFLSCNSSQKKAVNQNDIFATDTLNYIVPERIYATNTAIPFSQFNVCNVIDGDEKTIWKTPLGAGTDEGIMFYFKDPIKLGSVKIKNVQGDSYASVRNYIVYADGKLVDINRINTTVSSVFIRVGRLSNQLNKNISNYDSDENESNTSQIYYPTDKCVAISEVTFFDDNNLKIPLRSPDLINANVKASSTLEPVLGYSPSYLFDGKKEFGWAEGAATSGKGEFVDMVLEQDIELTAIKIWNGYQRSDTHFKDNARVKSIIIADDKGNSEVFKLEDTPDAQMLNLGTVLQGNIFKLTIDEVYPGKKYSDCVISEVVLFNEKGPIKVLTGFEEEVIKNNWHSESHQLKGVLDRLINIRTYNNDNDIYTTLSKSLILRSNHSFVYYLDSSYAIDNITKNKTTIAEGGWEIENLEQDKVVLRIFGKMYDTHSESVLYKGKQESSSTNIFQDFITITDSTILGKSFIDKINLLW